MVRPAPLRGETFRLVGLSFLVACGSGKPDDSGPEPSDMFGAWSAACGRTADVGQQMIPGTAVATTAPAIPGPNTPATITLDASRGGYVRSTLDAGTYYFFLSQTEVLRGLYSYQGALTPPEPVENPDCPEEIPAWFQFESTGPGDIYLQIAPSVKGEMWVMFYAEDTFGAAATAE